jgi:hypothetical protein
MIQAFRAQNSPPPRFMPFPASIPLVGERFVPGRSLMVYASAENLTWMTSGRPRSHTDHFEGERAYDRYRNQFLDPSLNSERFFPHVGIQPVSNGGLLCGAYHASLNVGLPVDEDPRRFVEHLALTNWGKFTLCSRTNKDYAGDRKMLEVSLPLVEVELARLRPGLVLLPHKIWNIRKLREAMQIVAPATRFVPVAQCHATVVNTHLRGLADRAEALHKSQSGRTLDRWMSRLAGMNREHAWRYLVHLEDALRAG